MTVLGKWLPALLAATAMALTTTAPAQAAPGRVIRITGYHTIHTHAQADRYLAKTPERFRDFVVRRTKVVQRQEEAAGGSQSCVRRSGVVIEKYHTHGYATGGEGGCGGAATLYTDYAPRKDHGKRHGGHWRMVKATQDNWYCPVLKRYRVPSALVGTTCYSPARHHELPYHQR
jgi:hypothetical protein